MYALSKENRYDDEEAQTQVRAVHGRRSVLACYAYVYIHSPC